MMEQIKIKFKILYKNGIEDIFERIVTETNLQGLKEVQRVIETSMREGVGGHISLGDGESLGIHVRLSEVVRVSAEIIEGVAD